jgi:hypothetical protein
VRFFLARRAGRVVGRIAAQVDHAYLERYADATGHFGCLVAEDDPAIFAALFASAEQWLRSKGMTRVTGPFNLSVNEEVGLMVWGFESRPMLLVPYDPPYAGPRVEGCGYAKIKDVFAYDYDVQNAPETIGAKLMARAGMAGRVRVRTPRCGPSSTSSTTPGATIGGSCLSPRPRSTMPPRPSGR